VTTHPLFVQITTRDGNADREVQQQFLVHTRFPRWELVKIFVKAFFQLKVR
jgi:hypothetical protein